MFLLIVTSATGVAERFPFRKYEITLGREGNKIWRRRGENRKWVGEAVGDARSWRGRLERADSPSGEESC